MKNIDIIYLKYLDTDNKTPTVGGIQTYITDLSRLIAKMGITLRIIQCADTDYVYNLFDDVTVVGFKIDAKNADERYQKLYDASVSSQKDDTLTVFATDLIIPKKVRTKAIAIQHGICWDIPITVKRSFVRQTLCRMRNTYRIIDRLNRMDDIVCVDYNFLNWYRAEVDCVEIGISVIPNYSHIAPMYIKPKDEINIIFARRFYTYRGTRVFTKAIRKLLLDGYDINVTIAGSGEDENWMKEQLKEFENVTFTRYNSDESIEIHKDKHIAVVPTVGSEGTSLSLLEAMSAQCAVICTDVGGMTNIVLDGFNGLMVPAGKVDELYIAIKELIENSDKRNMLAKNGYETVKSSFSYEKWKNSWKKVLKDALE